MAERYKKIIFNKLDEGSGEKFLDVKNPTKINTSLGIIPNIETGRLELAPAFAEFNKTYSKPYTYYSRLTIIYPFGASSRIYSLVYNSNTTKTELLTATTTCAPSTTHSFSATSTYAYMLAPFRDKILAWYKDVTTKQDYSTNNGTTFTSQAWAYDIPISYIVTEDQTIYVVTENEIVKSVDGITWTEVVNLTGDNLGFLDISELDGEIYCTIYNGSNSVNWFCKLDSDNVPIIIRDFQGNQISIRMMKFDNRIIIADYAKTGKIFFYEWTKAEIKKIAYYNVSATSMWFMLADDQFLYFAINRETIIQINKNNAIYKIETLDPSGTGDYLISGYKYKGNLCLTFLDVSNDTQYFLYHRSDASETKQATGKFTLPRISVGQQVPAYIIVKHDRLSDNSSVVIKAKSDDAATFATTILTSDVENSVRKQVALKSLLDQVDFLDLEVTLADSDDTGLLDNLEIIYLYTPVGIENS